MGWRGSKVFLNPLQGLGFGTGSGLNFWTDVEFGSVSGFGTGVGFWIKVGVGFWYWGSMSGIGIGFWDRDRGFSGLGSGSGFGSDVGVRVGFWDGGWSRVSVPGVEIEFRKTPHIPSWTPISNIVSDLECHLDLNPDS
ncbi:hypothetical protein TIFTF001_006209 [Ficus carica]|uniref:Uncharacterized protein n=1 Tax=Ficus carica TaxID=3494 RepID=A0AA88AA19_FICCA|nr:hypothetical protein TIFTF001_006209 [Ficus carica]